MLSTTVPYGATTTAMHGTTTPSPISAETPEPLHESHGRRTLRVLVAATVAVLVIGVAMVVTDDSSSDRDARAAALTGAEAIVDEAVAQDPTSDGAAGWPITGSRGRRGQRAPPNRRSNSTAARSRSPGWRSATRVRRSSASRRR